METIDPTAEEERRTRCLTIRRPIIPFRAKRRGAAALSGHQHGDDLPVPPCVCMKCRRVIVPRKWALILHDLAEFLGYFWLFGIWFWPSVGVAPAKSIALPSIALFLLCMRGAAPLAYAAIRGCWIYRTEPTRISMPGRRRRGARSETTHTPPPTIAADPEQSHTLLARTIHACARHRTARPSFRHG